ncbi:carbohydate-binding domain-containing protein [Spirosoma telluris]|uniref:carbohydate-binding domain-containing protein n=1 Tax=Spirosoma telluris TaxID=2183553 RepID=UPI002FC2D846
MRTTFFASLLTLIVIGFNGCKSGEAPTTEEAKQIAVSWELVSNFTELETGFEARFTLTNRGDFPLTDTNWALFFNMSPRPIVPTQVLQPATVHHINGDWYKLTPNVGFSLKPGATVEIRYEGTEAVTKVTDAPLGLYFVFYDKSGQEKNIVQVANYSIKPFTRRNQQLRGKIDLEPLPTAEHTYQTNLTASLLPADQLQKIIPAPVSITTGGGTLSLTNSFPIHYGKGWRTKANY